MEPETNPFIGERATFHYFMIRKFFFGSLSSGFVACEGGWGTRDELFEMLTLVQTGKAPVLPIVYLSSDPRHLDLDFQHALRKKYVSPDDLDLIDLVKTPERAVQVISRFYHNVDRVTYDREQMVRIKLKKKVPPERRRKVGKILGDTHEGLFDLDWTGSQLILYHYTPNSYGPLRRAINLLNE